MFTEFPQDTMHLFQQYAKVVYIVGQFRRFVILFDEGVIQIREINLGNEIRCSNLYFGHSNSHLRVL